MALKIIEEEVWMEEIRALSNTELCEQLHLYQIRKSLLQDELSERILRVFPELELSQIKSTAPAVRLVMLERFCNV